MELKDFSIGERLSLRVMLSDETFSSIVYTSQIAEFPTADQLYITSPTTSDMKAWMGRKVQVDITRDNAVYDFTAQVMGQKIENSVYLILLKQLSELSKVQRRDYFRLKIELKVYTTTIGSVKTINISGSGMAIKVPTPLEDNSVIAGVFGLDTERVRFKGKVISTEMVQLPNEPIYYIARLKYFDMNTKEQDKIVKFINHQQVESRIKRLYLQ